MVTGFKNIPKSSLDYLANFCQRMRSFEPDTFLIHFALFIVFLHRYAPSAPKRPHCTINRPTVIRIVPINHWGGGCARKEPVFSFGGVFAIGMINPSCM